ncbi:MAG: hypothetical protein AB8B72_11905 [Crocinitomicaceae bacterium]
MKNLFIIFGFIIFISCSSSKEFLYYQVTLETENLIHDDKIINPLYQKKDNQCGAFFLEGENLTVINNFDTSNTFVNLQYKYEKDSTGIHDTYTFEDVFLKKKDSYQVISPLSKGTSVLEFKKGKVIILDKNTKLQVREGIDVYIRTDKDDKGIEFYETYTVIKTPLTKVIYDKYSFPCE